MTAHIVIPFRDRGRDPLRGKNLGTVVDWWTGSPWPIHVIDDGRDTDAQFNRSAAYNRGLKLAAEDGADVVIYTESDMLVPWAQIEAAVHTARCHRGLVIGFTSYRYLSEHDAARVRGGARPKDMIPESTMDNGASIGAVNVVSLDTMQAVGQWDETFEGSWYDDTAMFHAFRVAAGEPRWVAGPGWHLYHLPGWTGDHLTDEDRAATARNAARWELYRQATTAERIRELTAGGA
jgi:hypothetical protein